jgi:hypothetical protein
VLEFLAKRRPITPFTCHPSNSLHEVSQVDFFFSFLFQFLIAFMQVFLHRVASPMLEKFTYLFLISGDANACGAKGPSHLDCKSSSKIAWCDNFD